MATRPYERTFDDCGMLCFEAELRAFATIGQRFEELQRAYRDFMYPQSYVGQWRRCVAAIKKASNRVSSRDHWLRTDGRLEKRFGPKYRRVKWSVARRFTGDWRRSNRDFRAYLRLLVAHSEILVARFGGDVTYKGIDIAALVPGILGLTS